MDEFNQPQMSQQPAANPHDPYQRNQAYPYNQSYPAGQSSPVGQGYPHVQDYAGYTGYQGYSASEPPKSGMENGALICGIASLVFALVLGFLVLVGPLAGIALGIAAVVLAGKAVRAMGQKTGKTTAAKVCGIIGAAISSIMLILTIAVGCLAYVFFSEVDQEEFLSELEYFLNEDMDSFEPSNSVDALDDIFGSGSGSGLDSSGLYPGMSSTVPDATDESMAQATSEVTDLLDALAPVTEENLKLIADMADEDIFQSLGYSMEEMGIDPMDYARWITAGLSYEIDEVVLSELDGVGYVGVYVTVRDVFVFIENYDILLGDFLDSKEFAEMTSENEALTALGEVFYDAMDLTKETTVDYGVIDMVYENGTWSVDEESWMFEVDWLFGLA